MSYEYWKKVKEVFPNDRVCPLVLQAELEADPNVFTEILGVRVKCNDIDINDQEDCYIKFVEQPGSVEKSYITAVCEIHLGNPFPQLPLFHASSVLTVDTKLITAVDPNWEEVGGSVTSPGFFSQNLAACRGRIVGMYQTNGEGARLRISEDGSPAGYFELPDTEGEWEKMQWFSTEAPSAGPCFYELDGRLPQPGAGKATEAQIKYVAVSLLEFI